MFNDDGVILSEGQLNGLLLDLAENGVIYIHLIHKDQIIEHLKSRNIKSYRVIENPLYAIIEAL